MAQYVLTIIVPVMLHPSLTPVPPKAPTRVADSPPRPTTAAGSSPVRPPHALAQLEALLDHAPVGFALLDTGLRFVRINERLALMNGLPVEAHIGRSITEVLPGMADTVVPLVERVLATGEALQDLEVAGETPAASGVLRHWLAGYYPVMLEGDDRPRYIGLVVIEITDRKRAEAQLQRMNETLEARVEQRTAVAENQAQMLQALARELTEAEHRERRRLATTLHEDLQQVLAATGMVNDRLMAKAGADQAQGLQSLRDLLREAIGASRALALQLCPPVLYERGLGPAVTWLGRHFESRRELMVEVLADPEAEPADEHVRLLLFDAVRELLNLAAESDRPERVLVTIEKQNDRVSITMNNFDGSWRKRLQRPAVRRLGQRLSLLHGELHAYPAAAAGAASGGAAVRMTAPLDRLSPVPEGHATAGRHGLRLIGEGGEEEPRHTIRVLLADDHRILREGLVELLSEEEDLEVVGQAADGVEAVELGLALEPDVVVMDITMPQMNGIEATRQLLAKRPRTRVIGLSMHEEDDMARAMRDAGAEAYLTKGGPSDDLVAAIRGG